MSTYEELKAEFSNNAYKNTRKDKKSAAIEMAYADMSRHAYGHKKEIKEHCVKWLLNEVFTDDLRIEDFDTWHERICEELVAKLNDKKAGFGTIGRAQKVINMAIKYLSCISDQYNEILKDCHMTLDGYTLAWYQSCAKTDNKHGDNKWSKIERYEDYMAIQNEIREHLKQNQTYSIKIDSHDSILIPLPISPFEAEFIIWEAKIVEEKYNSLIKALKNYISETGGKRSGREKDKWIIGEKFDDFLREYYERL